MPFAPEKAQNRRLAELGSTWRTTRLKGGDQPEGTIECRIVDNLTGKAWATATAPSEPEAFEKALAVAESNPTNKPETPSQTKQRADRLEAENARLRAQIEGKASPADDGAAEPPEPPETPEAPDGESEGDQSADDGFSELDDRELVQALNARGLEVPDRRHKGWREEAEQKLREATQ